MKLTFVIVGTLIEFSMDIEPDSPYTKPTKVYYGFNEYEAKLYSQNEYEMLFHLYLIHKKPEIKQIISDDTFKAITDTTSHLADTLRYSIGWPYQKFHEGEIDYSNPIAKMVKPRTREENIQILKHELKVAIRAEDYELCAKLRDKINEL